MPEPKLEKEFELTCCQVPRAALMISLLTRKLQVKIMTVYKDKMVADIMGVLTLSMAECEPGNRPKDIGHMPDLRIKLIIQGSDSAAAMVELIDFFARCSRQRILEKKGLEKEFILKWRLGLLAAKTICRIAKKFQARLKATIKIVYKDKTIIVGDCNEVAEINNTDSDPAYLLEELGLMPGSCIKLAIQGPNAEYAMEDLTEFLTSGPSLGRCPVAGCSSTLAPVCYLDEVIVYECERGHSWEIDRTRPVEKQKLQPSKFGIYGKPSFDKDFPNKA